MIVIVLLLLTIIGVILFGYDYYMHHSKHGRLIDQIPGRKHLPIFGNVLDFQLSNDKLWYVMREWHDSFYPIFKVWAGSKPLVSIRHPDDFETILNNTKHIEKGLVYTFLHPWLNTGLLTSGGDKWYSRRKILTPAFHFNILRQFVDILVEESERMTKHVGEAVEKDVVDFVSKHTLNAICETAMGISLHSLGAAQKEYRKNVQQISACTIQRFMKPWFYPDLIFALSRLGRLQKKSLQHLHGFTEKIIAERKLYHERTKGQYLQNIENGYITEKDDVEVHGIRKKRLAMLDLLIAASRTNHLNDRDIREEVDTFMFEGHDTTAMGISFTLLLLAEHRDIQDRVRLEVNTVMEQFGEKLTITSLQNLTYLDRCLKESLRLYPNVHFISRIVAEDIQLQSYLIPRGTDVQLNIFSVHRDANFWPNPDVFDPDRFLPERIQSRHPYSYLPFSAGPRNCIGQRFAMLEMKAMVATLVHNFYLEPVDYLKNMELTVGLILRPKNPMHIKLVPIETS